MVGAIGLSFNRVARAVRQTIGLSERLELEEAVRAEAGAEARKAAWLERQELAPQIEAARAVVGDAIGRQPEIETREKKRDPWKAQALMDALYERLEDADDEILELPVSTVVADVCRALGVSPDWSLWENDDWAMEEADNAAEPGPYGTRPLPRRRIELPPRSVALRLRTQGAQIIYLRTWA